MMKVSIIGTGNVATHLFKVFLKSKEIEIVQIIGRSEKSFEDFPLKAKTTTDFLNLKDADLYIIAISDNAIKTVSEQLNLKRGLIVHTSGSTRMSELSEHARFGVFYPLQTFSKTIELNFKKVPICIEAHSTDDLFLLKKLAQLVSEKVFEINSVQRKSLHLAAVYVNNFTNHLYHVGSEICKENNVPFEILSPLIKETAQKIVSLSPYDAQTGPARRNDTNTIKNHLEELNNPEFKAVYKLLSKSIQTTYGKEL